jgi:hypothetical protein
MIEIGTRVRKVRGNYDRGREAVIVEIGETKIHPKYGPITEVVLNAPRTNGNCWISELELFDPITEEDS